MTRQRVPEDRYGSRVRNRMRPWLRWLIIGLTAVALVGGTVLSFNNLGNQPIKGEQAAFQVLNDHSVRVTVEVQRNDPEREAECVVRARARSGVEVGRREVFIPPSDGTARYATTLRTSTRAFVGEVYGCTYNVPEYLSNPTRPIG